MVGDVMLGGQKADVLMLHLLGRCNLECAHCYMEGSPRRRERLALNTVLQAIAECKALGVGSVSLTGGEPLLQQRALKELFAHLAPDIAVEVETNGTIAPDPEGLRRVTQWNVSAKLSSAGDPEQFRIRPDVLAIFRDSARAYLSLSIHEGAHVEEVT